MPDPTAKALLSQDEMIHVCADMGRNSMITVVSPYLIQRQEVARKLLQYYGNAENRAALIEMLNWYNTEIAKLMGLMPPDTLF